MSSSGSYQYKYDVNLEDPPVLEEVDNSQQEIERLRRADKVECFHLASMLTMIQLSSYFRNRLGPLSTF